MTLELKREELRGVEQELTALQEDRAKLLTLRDKYAADFASAESAWKSDRGEKRADAMLRAKGLTDTVRTALADLEGDLARVTAYRNTLRDEIRHEEALASLGSNGVARLASIQGEYGSRLRALQEHLTAELLALDALAVEWDTLHHESWGVIRDLGLSPQDAERKLTHLGVDPAPLRLVLLAPKDPQRQTHYRLPLRAQQAPADLPGKVERISGNLLLTGLSTTEAERNDLDWKQRQHQREEERQELRRRLWDER